MPFLDSELVDILAHIDDNHHFNIINLLSSVQCNNTNMENFASDFLEYSNLCKKLEDYYNKKLLEFRGEV